LLLAVPFGSWCRSPTRRECSVTGLTAAPAQIEVAVDATSEQEIVANRETENCGSSPPAISWSVSPTGIAELTATSGAGTRVLGKVHGTATITASSGGVTSNNVAVSVYEPARIVLDKARLDFAAVGFGASPPAQNVGVDRAGDRPLQQVSLTIRYATGGPIDWLAATASGSTAPLSIQVRVTRTDLAAGNYSATVDVQSAVASNAPQSFAVGLVVSEGLVSVQGWYLAAIGGNDVTGAQASVGQIALNGALSDELTSSGTLSGGEAVDRRSAGPNNPLLGRAYQDLQQARRSAEAVALRDQGTDLFGAAEAYLHAGMAYIHLAEDYCSGVPIRDVDAAGTITATTTLTTSELFDRSAERLTAAIALAQAAGSPALLNWARVARARARLGNNRFPEAGADAATVPLGTVKSVPAARGIWNWVNSVRSYSVADVEGVNGLNYRGAGDIRVPWSRVPANAVGEDGVTPHYSTGKYASASAPVEISGGIEAELIRAEVFLQTGSPQQMLNSLNTIRASRSLPGVSDPGTTAARVELLYRERAFWLHLTGHRLGDMRRLVRQHGRAIGSVFPTGDHPKGGQYGADVALPLPLGVPDNPTNATCDPTIP
jgi:hypothetical protein